MSKNYNTRTASLKATIADIRNLDAKQIDAEKISLNGKPIIGELKDLRGDTATDNDIWPNGVQIDENGNVTLYPLGYNKTPIPMQIGSGPDSVFKGNKIIDKNTGEILQWIDSDSLTASPDGTSMTVLFNCESVETSLNGIPDNANLTFDVQCKEFKVDMLNTNCSLEITNTSESEISIITLNAPKLGYLRVNTENISEFNGDLSGITNGNSMFYNCTNLTSFNGDLSSLTYGNNIFANCTNLTSFSSNLSSLTNGSNMFNEAKLDASSLANIIHTINTPATNGTITIGLGIDDTDEARQALAEAIWCKDWDDVNQEFANKNWTVTWYFNGAPTE